MNLEIDLKCEENEEARKKQAIAQFYHILNF